MFVTDNYTKIFKVKLVMIRTGHECWRQEVLLNYEVLLSYERCIQFVASQM